jgi:CheY-like chemotaxis protein
MDRILILGKDNDFVQSLKKGLDKMSQFHVSVTTRGEEAIAHMGKNKVSVFVIDIAVSDMDALDILSYMSKKHPHTPCIVMTDHKKPWFKERMARQSFLYHLEKPFNIGALANAVFVGLNLRDEGVHLEGMTMASVLPIVEIIRKTCRIKVSSKGHGTGYLYFNEGIIVDAHYKELRHDAAADEIAKWKNIIITLSDLPQRRQRTRVKKKIMDLAGASWNKNESLEKQDHDEPLRAIETLGLVSDNEIVLLESIDDMLDKFISRFNAIKGFKAIAVAGKEKEVLAFYQIDDHRNINGIAKKSLNAFLSASQNAVRHIGFQKCEAMTLHSPMGVIIIVQSKSEADPEFNLIGIISPDGDWVGMKNCLEELNSVLKASAISAV